MTELYEGMLRAEAGSSKGNQLKWFDGDSWYKADYAGYEGLAEYVCSYKNIRSRSSTFRNVYRT